MAAAWRRRTLSILASRPSGGKLSALLGRPKKQRAQMGESVRQRLLTRLRWGPTTLRELALEVELNERETADHLAHAIRSLDPGEKLRETPAECRACGFVFRKRERLKTPSRCPGCRSERIQPASFWIERRGS